MKKRTRITHLPDVPVPPDNRPLVAPIYQSVKFTFDDVAETRRLWMRQREGFYYSRVSNPTCGSSRSRSRSCRSAMPAC